MLAASAILAAAQAGEDRPQVEHGPWARGFNAYERVLHEAFLVPVPGAKRFCVMVTDSASRSQVPQSVYVLLARPEDPRAVRGWTLSFKRRTSSQQLRAQKRKTAQRWRSLFVKTPRLY